MIATHTTHSAGGVVISQTGKILIVSQQGTSWSLPKGHVEEGEEFLEAAKREITEESGIMDLEVLKEFPSYERFKIGADGKDEDKSELKVIHMFLFRTTDSELKPIDPDNPEAMWLPPERIAEMLTHPKDQEFFKSIFADVKMYILSKVKRTA
jgi:ADP-ribose pyrophosphatase YjhB (NUDIX family)